ncbi:MAG: M24 family metallopeptidase [Chloroflexota bacterium]|nr:M24 family metallopeptidase [Chloroflexota bacterium]
MIAPEPSIDPPVEQRAEVVAERIDQVHRLLRGDGSSGVLLTSRAAFAWLTLGGQNHVVAASADGAVPLLVTPTGCYALAAANEAPRIADEELLGLPVEIVTVPWHEADAVADEARRICGGEPITEAGLGSALVDLRLRLGPVEQERLRWLGARAGHVMRQGLEAVTQGSSEDELAARVHAALAAEGVRLPVILVAADERIDRYRHPLPKGRPIERRVMLVVVGERWGLHVAATRILDLEPPSAELQQRMEATDRVLGAMRAATAPGRTLGDVLSEARAAYSTEGFPNEWTLHHQGGLIGYQGRERIATPGDTTLIRAGMAVAWNPSITGAKAEATDLLGDSGLEVILE